MGDEIVTGKSDSVYSGYRWRQYDTEDDDLTQKSEYEEWKKKMETYRHPHH